MEQAAGPEVAVDEAWDVEKALIPGANVTLTDTAAMTNRKCDEACTNKWLRVCCCTSLTGMSFMLQSTERRGEAWWQWLAQLGQCEGRNQVGLDM